MINRVSKLAAVAAVAGCAAMAGPTAALADNSALLAAYQGDWRGSGEARPNPQSQPLKVSCKISAVFDSARIALSNTGRCGTTQGSRNLNGTLTASGSALSGDFLGGTATQEVTNQKLRIADGMIVSEGEMQSSGKVLKLRTFLTPPKDGSFLVQSQFYDWGTRSWVVAGEIKFSKQ